VVGVTSPLASTIPDWSRRNAADLGFLSANPALLPLLPEERGRVVPLALSVMGGGSVWNLSESLTAAPSTVGDLLEELGGTAPLVDEVQRTRMEINAHVISEGLGVAFGYARARDAVLRDDGSLYYEGYQEGRVMVGAAGRVFDTPKAGLFALGMNLKGVARKGDEVEIAAPYSVPDELLSSGDRSALAVGLDLGLLYRLPSRWTGTWTWEGGFNWRDMGETAFALGAKTSRGGRFSPYPNDLIFGIGVGTPGFWRGSRAGFRAEIAETGRKVSTFDRIGFSGELRLPVLLSLQAGLRGGRFAAGAVLRYPGIEIEVAARNALWGRDSTLASRSYVMEIRGVY
jgi:hypothetical protein